MALIFDEIQGKVLKIGRDDDNLIDFSTDNQIRFRVNGSDEANMTNAFFYPHSNDGMALGIGTNAWSDLFLASGAVINFNNGDVTLTHSGNNLAISGGNLEFTGYGAQFADNAKIQLGASNDLQIYHDGSHSYITGQSGAGSLYIRPGVGNTVQIEDTSGNDMITAGGGGAVNLYYNNSLKLSTTSSGVQWTGNMFGNDGQKLICGNGADLQIYHTGGQNYINALNTLNIATATSGVQVNIGHTTSEVVVNDNLTVTGDLTIVGDTIMQSTTNTTISDTIIRLNAGVSGTANTSDTGLMFNRGTSDRVFFGWDESADKFIMVTTSTAADAAAGNVAIANDEAYQTLVANIQAPLTATVGGNNVMTVAGGTMSGAIAMGNNNISGVANLFVNAGNLSITGDGSHAVTLTQSGNGDFTIDAPDDIRLDAGGGDVVLRTGGTEYGRISSYSNNLRLTSSATNADIILQPNGTGNVDINGNADISGTLTFSASSDIVFPDNAGAALEFKEGSNLYMRFVTTNGGEKIEVNKNLTLATGSNLGFTLDGNTITGIDDSGEFTDDDNHIMTSAGIHDKYSFASFNYASGTFSYDDYTARGLYRFQGGTDGPAGGSHTTGLVATESSGNYGFQLVSNGSADNTEKLFYRYRGSSWENWQTIVTKTFGDGRYATAAQGTLATNALPKSGGTMTGTITMVDSNVISGSGDVKLYARSTDSGASFIQFQNTSTGSSNGDGLTVGVNGTTAYVWQRENTNLLLGTNDTTAVTINNSQEVTVEGGTLTIASDGSSGHTNSRVILKSTQNNARGAGVFMHNENDDQEFYMGVPYSQSFDRFMIAHKSTASHTDATAHYDNVLFDIDTSGTATFTGNLRIPSRIEHDGDTNTWIGFDDGNDTFRVVANGSEKLHVNSTRTRISNNNLEVNGDLDLNGNADISGTTNLGVTNFDGLLTWTGTDYADAINLSEGDLNNANEINAYEFKQRATGEPRNNLGTPTVTEMALFEQQFKPQTTLANDYNNLSDIAFYKQDNNGDSWDTVTVIDAQKKKFLRTNNSNVVIPNGTYKYRVEFVAHNYTFANALYGYTSTNSHNMQVHIWKRRCSDNTWIQHTSSTSTISSWPGHLYLPFSTIPWHETNTTSTGHFNMIRIEYTPNWIPYSGSGTDYSGNNISLYGMQIWGGYPTGRRTPHSYNEDGEMSLPDSLSLKDGKYIRLGDSDDLQIYHDGSNSYIDDAGTGNILIRGTQVVAQKYTGETLFKGISDGAFEAYHNNVKKFETTSSGVTVTGDTNIAGNLQVTNNGGTLNLVGTDHSYIQFYPDGTSAGRKAYTGYGGATSNDFAIVNEISGGSVQINTNGGSIQLQDNTVVTGELEATSLDINGNADISGTLNVSGGSTLAGDPVIHDDSSHVRLYLRSDSSHQSLIYFGRTGATTHGRVAYNNANDSLYFNSNNATALTLDSSQNATFTGNVDFSNNKGLTWAGSHSVRVESNVLKLNASGGIQVQNNATFQGSITGKDSGIIIDSIGGPYGRIHGTSSIFLGGGSTSNVQISGALIPDGDSSRNLGSGSRYWAHGYIDAITTTGNINLTSGNYIHFDNGVSNDYYIRKSSTELEFKTGGEYNFLSGNASFAGSVNITGGNTGQLTITSGNVAWDASIDLDTGDSNGQWRIKVEGSDETFRISNVDQGGTAALSIHPTTKAATFAGTITTDRVSLFTSNTDRATIQAGSSGTTGHLYFNSYEGSDLHQLTWSGANNGFYPQGASGTFSLGLNGNRWSNVYTTLITASGEIEGGSLDINGSADFEGAVNFGGDVTIINSIIHAGDSNTYFGFHDNDQWRVVTGGTERFEVTDSTTTVQNDLTVVGDLTANKRKLAKTSNTDGDADGDIVYFGSTTSMEVGKIYYLNSSGNWALTDADAEATAKGMLAVALGSASDTDGMLIRGMVTLDHDPGSVGHTLFLHTTAGQATITAPSGNGDIVRVIGYMLDSTNGQIYFNPDGTFVEVTA